MTGMSAANYYIRQIDYPSRLSRIHYILYYSCLKTLATKHKITSRAVGKKYGYIDIPDKDDLEIRKTKKMKKNFSDIRIITNHKMGEKFKYTVLLNYKEYMFRIKRLREGTPAPKDIDMLALNKVNLRTAFMLNTACIICGSKEKLQIHHIKPLRRNGKVLGKKVFDKVFNMRFE
jgi:hypothetical protein